MKLWIGAALLAVGISLTGCSLDDSVIQPEEEKRQFELSAESIEALNMVLDSGDLIVKGDEKATAIRVDADIKTKNINPEDIVVTLAQEGNTAKLLSEVNTDIGFNYLDLTLTVTVPAQMPITITGQSGDMDLMNLTGKLTIEDDSGDIRLTNTSGEAEIRDQSGDISLENTAGNTEIRDQSGELSIIKHKGDLKISDQSGDINIDTVDGDVLIENDDSGERVVQNIKGSYTSK